jgi:hypothetical protein
MLLLTDEKHCLLVCLMVFNATFNNISVIWWRSVLLVEETAVPGENHRPVASHWHILSHNVVHLALVEIRTHNLSGDRYWLHSWLFCSRRASAVHGDYKTTEKTTRARRLQFNR